MAENRSMGDIPPMEMVEKGLYHYEPVLTPDKLSAVYSEYVKYYEKVCDTDICSITLYVIK